MRNVVLLLMMLLCVIGMVIMQCETTQAGEVAATQKAQAHVQHGPVVLAVGVCQNGTCAVVQNAKATVTCAKATGVKSVRAVARAGVRTRAVVVTAPRRLLFRRH